MRVASSLELMYEPLPRPSVETVVEILVDSVLPRDSYSIL
jgi:hypothetical protein